MSHSLRFHDFFPTIWKYIHHPITLALQYKTYCQQSQTINLTIFRMIAEEGNSGLESHIICRNIQLTHRKYYQRLAALIRNGLIIRKDGRKKYILSSLGKVVYSNLLPIQYALDNIWKFRAIDEMKICDNSVRRH